MIWGGRWEGGSGLETHVHPWPIHVNVWQNQYSTVKQNKVKLKIKKNKNKNNRRSKKNEITYVKYLKKMKCNSPTFEVTSCEIC